jgi:xanthine dehydrogenase accessory factor
MNEWIDSLSDLSAAGERVVLVTVASVRGSAPREPGAKMIVTRSETVGTIGGGQLEHQCTRIAVGMLDDSEQRQVQSFPLGSSMGQCCGGVVDVLFEPISSSLPRWLGELRAMHGQRLPAVLVTGTGAKAGDEKQVLAGDAASRFLEDGRKPRHSDDCFYEPIVASDLNIAVFGAGHVGSAVVAALSALDCNIRWIDSRRNIFRHIPRNVRAIESETPALEVAALPAQSYYLVMTHSHALDYDIVDRILRRGDARYCGLIGSRSKRRRFEKRYRAEGMPQALLDNLVCPIGVDGITGKKPAEIAVAAAAEILQVYEAASGGAAIKYPENVHTLNH